MVCQDAQDATNFTLMGGGSALVYFGLLQSCEILNINSEDFTLNEKENKFEVQFKHMNKQKNCGFIYTLLQIYTPLFTKYIAKLKKTTHSELGDRFTRNQVCVCKKMVLIQYAVGSGQVVICLESQAKVTQLMCIVVAMSLIWLMLELASLI